MNNFRKCFDDLVEWYNRLEDKDRSSHIVDCLEALKTLLDKVMPRKAQFNENREMYYCPNCGRYLFDPFESNYCPNCGSALDWSEDEETE